MNLLKKLRLEPTYDPWVVKGQNLLNFLSKGPRRLPGSRGFACINGSTIATSILVAMQPTGAAQEMSFWGLRIPWLWVKLPWHGHPFSVPQNNWVMDVHSPKIGDSRFWPIFRVELDPLPDIWAPCVLKLNPRSLMAKSSFSMAKSPFDGFSNVKSVQSPWKRPIFAGKIIPMESSKNSPRLQVGHILVFKARASRGRRTGRTGRRSRWNPEQLVAAGW